MNVSNGGPSTTGATMTDNLPSGVTFVSATSSQGVCSQSAGTVTCGLGDLASGGLATVTVKVTPQNAGTTISNTASVQGTVPDPNNSNNSATETTSVVAPTADLAVTKTDSPDPVFVGEPLTYTIRVDNNGPLTASSVTLSDSISKRLRFRSVRTTQGTCSVRHRLLTCALGDVISGDTVTVTLIVRPIRVGTVTNSATASAFQPADPDSSNNTGSASTSVSQ
jgi:uncharacterized repeat protein (TIGR01451 family)